MVKKLNNRVFDSFLMMLAQRFNERMGQMQELLNQKRWSVSQVSLVLNQLVTCPEEGKRLLSQEVRQLALVQEVFSEQ